MAVNERPLNSVIDVKGLEEEEEVYYPRNRSMEVEGILHSPYKLANIICNRSYMTLEQISIIKHF